MTSAELRPSGAQRVRHETKRRELQVLRVTQPGPHVRRIAFGGDELAGFVSLSFDDHVKLLLPVAGQAEPVGRDYTPRHHDAAAGELTIDFALHGDGPATAWASQAAAGMRLQIGGPRGSFILPAALDWQLLVGDDTAMPAIARRLEELPAGSKVSVILQVVDPADRHALGDTPRFPVHWVATPAECLEAVRAWSLPGGTGYAWCAGERGLVAECRRLLVDEKGHDRHAIRASAYWKRGRPAHHERLDAV